MNPGCCPPPLRRIIRLNGTPAAEIGRVQAKDADEAITITIEYMRSRRPYGGA